MTIQATSPNTNEVPHRYHYYSFGMLWDLPDPLTPLYSDDNRYQYNGKEFEQVANLLDYGWRWYDPVIGRRRPERLVEGRGGVDPLAEHAPAWTPYRYGFNNPILYIDPDGLFESRADAREYVKAEGIRTGLFGSHRIEKNDMGTYNLAHRRDGSFKTEIDGVVSTGGTIEERGVHLRDIGLDGFNDLSNPYSESYNPDAVIQIDWSDRAYYFGTLLGFASPSARLLTVSRGIKFPGTDPAKAPIGYEWRGKTGAKPGSKDGNWYNPETGESLRPDLNHPSPVGPHWDYRDPSGNWWRLFPDGSNVPKS